MSHYTKEHSVSPPKGDKQKQKKKLNYYKCEQCRNDRQRCDDEPEKRTWPGRRCHRCIKYNYPCGENVDSEGKSMPMRKTSRYTPSPSPGPYGNSANFHQLQAFYSPSANPRGQSPNYDPFNDLNYNPDYNPEYTQANAASPATSRSLSSHGYPALDSIPLQTPSSSMTSISIINFAWLHNYKFSSYVHRQLSQKDGKGLSTFYAMVGHRRREIQEHDNRLIIHSAVYPMVLQCQQQYQQSYMTAYGPQSNFYQTPPSLPQSFMTEMKGSERNGMRWRELIYELRSEEILLIDPHWSSGFIMTLEHGTDEDFYRAKHDVCRIGSEAREMCLRLSGVLRMIEQLQEDKEISFEVRDWLATEIERRIDDAAPLIAPFPSKPSSHGSLEGVQEVYVNNAGLNVDFEY